MVEREFLYMCWAWSRTEATLRCTDPPMPHTLQQSLLPTWHQCNRCQSYMVCLLLCHYDWYYLLFATLRLSCATPACAAPECIPTAPGKPSPPLTCIVLFAHQIHSPVIASLEVTRRSRVRRAKLYYLRERTGKDARLKELIVKKTAAAKKQ